MKITDSSVEIVFVANHLPPLKDGKYSIELKHKLNIPDEKSFSKTKIFAVNGERFKLNPSHIHKVFPPKNSQGNFDNVLPHIVLNRKTLPWERIPLDKDDKASWLAVFVFMKSMAPQVMTGTLSHLSPKNNGGKLPSDTYSYGSYYSSMDDFLSYGEKSTDHCLFFDLSKNEFAILAPTLKDLNWNAHARTKKKNGVPDKDFAIVVANRLPIPGESAVVHLVSLEGLGNSLPQNDGYFLTDPSWSKIRLVSLKSWEFNVSPLKASFIDLLQSLNGGINIDKSEFGDSQLRLPKGYTPQNTPEGINSEPYNSGYTTLSQGSSNTANIWYRGPLTPSTIVPELANETWAEQFLPSNSSNDLSVNVDIEPKIVQSFSAAWQLGRLLALADKEFATGQVSWKRDCRLKLNTLLCHKNKLLAGSRAGYAKMVRETLSDSGKIKSVLGTSLTTASESVLYIPQKLVDWLCKLALLENIPADYLIPDMKALPTESLKFFNVDSRWIASLLDGAWSLERQPKEHWAFDTAYQPWKQIMNKTLKPSFLPKEATVWPKSGIILNSQIIPGYWPGIEFTPTPQCNIIREDSLGPSTMLLLFDQLLDALKIQQPSEGIHFGFEINGIGNLSKKLRYIHIDGNCYPSPPKGENPPSGQEAPMDNGLKSIPQRIPGLIQFDLLASEIKNKIGLSESTEFTSAQMALELVESVSSANFILPNRKNPDHD